MRPFVSTLFFIVGFLSMNSEPSAFCVYNNTATSMSIKVTPGDFKKTIAAGNNACCNWSNGGCNPSKRRDAVGTLIMESERFQSALPMGFGGYGVISESVGHGVKKTFAETFRWTQADANVFLANTRSSLPHDDEIRFLGLADPQFDNRYDWDPNFHSEDVMDKILQDFEDDGRIRGVVVAGDLTMNTRPKDELKRYRGNMKGTFFYPGGSVERDYSSFFYEGLGNHDQASANYGQRLACRFGAKSCVDPGDLRNFIKRKRATVKSGSNNHHYSWDWGHVHFVQLNIFAGTDGDRDVFGRDPMRSLDFLESDLESRVGNSERPVVIIQHYPPDSIDLGNNRDAIIEDFYSAIKDYNVIGIIVGHTHSENLGAMFRGEVPVFVMDNSWHDRYYFFRVEGDVLTVQRRHVNGTYKVEDNCLGDPHKTEPGECGCGVPEANCDGHGR